MDPRTTAWAGALVDTTPLAAQTMVYFKPPGSRGQAMHQDQYFLRARPGATLAAWMALDACDDANGCIRVVPGSQDWPVLCPAAADPEVSFTAESLPLPANAPQVPVELDPGDVLFFNGSLVHGSMPNRTPDRFRRALIAHFIEERATASVDWVQPVLDPEGRELWLDEQDAGGGPLRHVGAARRRARHRDDRHAAPLRRGRLALTRRSDRGACPVRPVKTRWNCG